jgi:transforming growth factor-beta-induced protein
VSEQLRSIKESPMYRWLKYLLATSCVAFLAACGGGDDDDPGTIAAVAADSNLTALVAAADKAGLVDALSAADATLTVFAPTNAAFDALATTLGFADAGTMVAALDGQTLAKILTYHVLPARKTAAQLTAGTEPTLYTFDGAPARLSIATSGGVRVTDAVLTQARVARANVAARNGVVHVIDKVLVPPGVLNVVQMAQLNPAFSTLVSAVTNAGLAGTLSGPGPFTVFAPTNDAFAAIAGTVGGLTPAQLTTVLTYHVVGAEVLASGIPFGVPVATVSTQEITAGPAPAIASIADTTPSPARITAVDIRGSNGVIHVIDKVLLPEL